MSESLLNYFEQELAFIRKDAGDFSRRHPGVAKTLGINGDGIDDPQVTRLIESFAFMNAKLQQRLDDNYPQLTDSLLQLLFPHFTRPIPAYSIVKMQPREEVAAKYTLPKGTQLGINDNGSETAIFRTCQEVDLHPIELKSALVSIAPFDIAKPQSAKQAKAMLELEIETTDPTILFSDLTLDSLPIFLRGETASVLRLYDYLFAGTNQVCIRLDDTFIELGADALSPVGFDASDYVLPYSVRSFGGFKLLTEFFMFSERFHAMKVNMSEALSAVKQSTMKIVIFMDDMPIELARSLGLENFHLFCTPVINLQSLVAEPMKVDFSQSQYPIILDAGGQEQLQVFSIDSVSDVTDQNVKAVPSLYGEKFRGAQIGLRWQLKQAWNAEGRQLNSYLRVADLEHISASDSAHTLLINATCSNGDLSSQLSVSSDIHCHDSISLPADITLLRRPKPQIRIKALDQDAWPLLAHLHFNYQAIFGADDPVASLKAMLNLYNHNESSQNSAYVEAIVKLTQEQVVAPIRISGKSCFASGTRIYITLNGKGLGGGVELLSQLLDHFFAYFAGFNSFTQVVILLEGREGEHRVFPRRTGCKNLL